MPKDQFNFKKFTIVQDKTSMKVGTDSMILGSWVKACEGNKILDIGTGTGILTLMMAQKNIAAKIDAIEVDKMAYDQARVNIQNSLWTDRIEIVYINWKDFWPSCKEKYDLVICNPPYFNSSIISSKESRAKARHQIKLTLNDIFKGVDEILEENGRFHMILPYEMRNNALMNALTYNLFCNSILNIRPFAEKPYNRIIFTFEKKSEELKESELVIHALNSGYTKEYKELTKDFYL